MQFSRNRFTKWLLIIAGVLLVAGSGLCIYSAKFSADVNSKSTDIFADILEQPDLNDPTLIRLPERYTKDEITSTRNKSINGLEAKNLTTKESEINKYIADKALELAKNIPIVKDDKGRTINDLVFKVADFKGNTLKVKYPESKIQKSLSVESNFIFDSSVLEIDKSTLINAYPVIESLYGARSNSEPIKVSRDPKLYRAYYNGFDNLIMLDWYNGADEPIHELVHAFHGPYMLNSIWEEGMAVKVTQLVVEKMELTGASVDSSASLIYSGYEYRSSSELPSFDDLWVGNSATSLPYMYGSALADSLYASNNNFFKSFNEKLYQAPLGSSVYPQKVLEIIGQTNTNVEGEAVWPWLSKRYGLIPMITNQGDLPATFNFHLNSGYTSLIYNKIYPQFQSNYILGGSDFEINIFDSTGKILVNNSDCKNTKKSNYAVDKECGPFSPLTNYSGVIKIEVTPTANPENKKIKYLIHLSNEVNRSGNVFYILDLSTGDYAKITDSNGDSKILLKESDYFASADPWFKTPGNYKIETFKKKSNCTSTDPKECLGAKAGEKTYYRPDNKFMNSGPYSVAVPAKNYCFGRVNPLSVLNSGAKFSVASKINCGYVVSVNNILLGRYWGKNLDYALRTLKQNTDFNLAISLRGDNTDIKTQNFKLKTTNNPDLTITSSRSFGNPANNGFSHQLIFNYPVDMKSVNLSLRATDLPKSLDVPIAVSVVKLDSRTIDIRPKTKIYNNVQYTLVGIDRITDSVGNLITGYVNYQKFITPVNPVGGDALYFSLLNNTIVAGEYPVVRANFDLASYFEKNKTVVIQSCASGSACNQITALIVMAGSLLTLKTDAPLPVGDYSFKMLGTVYNNNYVADRDFSFSVR